MNDLMKKKSNKAFNAIISGKNTTIVTVVKEPFFRSKLKSPNKTLIEYLNEDRTIDQICDWVLTEEYIKEKNYKPISQLIIRIFKEAPEKILLSFSMNQKLIYRLQQFCKFEKKNFLIGFGHFQQIIELLSLSTRGAFLQNFNDFPYSLMKCIDIISIRYLFLSLASNYTQSFGFSKEVVLKMLQDMNDSNKHHIIFLFSKLSKGKTTYFAFDHSKVIYSLFELATLPSQSEFVITQALQIIEYVKRNTIIKEKIDIILKYFEPKIDFDNLPINFSTSILLKLFNNKFIPSLILLMINNPTHMFMHEGVMASIESASDEVLIDFVEKNNVPVKLIWAMNVAKSNGFLTKFAIMLNEKRNLSPCLQTPEWDNFVSNVLNKRLLILSGQFPSQFSNNEINQINSPHKKGQKRANVVQSKKAQQQQLNEKNRAKNDNDDKNEANKKDVKRRKEKNEKSQNDDRKEDNSSKTGKEKNQNDNDNINKNKNKSKSKNKNKNEEIFNNKENAERIANNIESIHESANKEDSKDDENKDKNKNEIKVNQNNENLNSIVESISENKNGIDEESANNSPLPKILDSLLIKNLILQRMSKNEDDQSNQAQESSDIPASEQQSISSDKEDMKIEVENNKIENEESNDGENNDETKENNEMQKSEKENENSSASKLSKGEIKSPSKKKNSESSESSKNNERKNKNEQSIKAPVKQSHTSFVYESPTHTNDHCRISLIKRKLYRNNEQSPQPKSPKEEKSRVRSFSVNWSPSAQPNSNSKSEDITQNEFDIKENENENIFKNRKWRRSNKCVCSDPNEIEYEKNDFSKIQKIDFSNDDFDPSNESCQIKRESASKNKRIIDLGDDFSSSSDDEISNNVFNDSNIIGPSSSSHYIHTIFGPAYISNEKSNQNDSSSDSSDNEFEFKFNPSPQRFMRRSSFNYRGSFNSTYDEMFGYK